MRLSGFRLEREAGRVRAAADMAWEDCHREPATLFFEVGEDAGAAMTANPHAFLLAAAVPALRYGEGRVRVDAPACPVLLEGLQTALAIMAAWHHTSRVQPPAIEVASRRSDLARNPVARAGSFFSGGIDSYATVRLNMQAYPEDHPYRIREGVVAFGLEQDDPLRFRHVVSVLEEAATALGLALTTVATNVYTLYRDEDARDRYRFWKLMFEGSALAAIAHSLTHRVSSMSISGSVSRRTLVPYGSHPMLDPSFSSSDLRIHHAGAGLTRLEKTALVVDLGVSPRQLRVCNQYRRYEASALNCGVCPKCVRTKLELVALGRDDWLSGFASQDLSLPLLRRRIHLEDALDVDFYTELVTPLREHGYTDASRWIAHLVRMNRWLGPDAGMRRLPSRVVHRVRTMLGTRLRSDRGSRRPPTA